MRGGAPKSEPVILQTAECLTAKNAENTKTPEAGQAVGAQTFVLRFRSFLFAFFAFFAVKKLPRAS